MMQNGFLGGCPGSHLPRRHAALAADVAVAVVAAVAAAVSAAVAVVVAVVVAAAVAVAVVATVAAAHNYFGFREEDVGAHITALNFTGLLWILL